jgi:hypothetical protein
MNRREAAKQLVELYAAAVAQGLHDDGTSAEVVALAVGSLLKDGEDE